MKCQKEGQDGFKWGESGTCYIGSDAREKALTQGKAIEASKHSDSETKQAQTYIFSKEKFTKAEAIAWAKKHNKWKGTIRETETSYRIRQINPDHFNKESFNIIEITKGVQAVIGFLKSEFKDTSPPFISYINFER